MQDVIEFRRAQQFLGRDGGGRMSGMLVERHGDHLYLAPITSKGQVGRAYLLVPVEQTNEVTGLMLRKANARP